MAEYTPQHLPGADVTYTATTAVLGGQVVEISATAQSAAPAGVGSAKVVGLAKYDAAVGKRFVVTSGGYQTPNAGAAITAGALVKSGAAGTVIPWVDGTDSPTLILGRAVNTQATTGQPVLVKWVA